MYMLQRCFNIHVGDSEEEFVSDRKRKFGEAAEGKERQLSVSCDLFFSYSRGIISSRQNLREEEEERNYECIQERCCNGQLLGINFPYCRFMYAFQVNVCGMEPSCNKKGRYQCATEYSEITPPHMRILLQKQRLLWVAVRIQKQEHFRSIVHHKDR